MTEPYGKGQLVHGTAKHGNNKALVRGIRKSMCFPESVRIRWWIQRAGKSNWACLPCQSSKVPKGPRYDPNQTVEERHAFGNLVLMCPIHHDVIDDDPDSYTVERLRSIKTTHEALNPENPRAWYRSRRPVPEYNQRATCITGLGNRSNRSAGRAGRTFYHEERSLRLPKVSCGSLLLRRVIVHVPGSSLSGSPESASRTLR